MQPHALLRYKLVMAVTLCPSCPNLVRFTLRGANLLCSFRKDETSTPISTHVNENENNCQNPKFKISQFFEQL